LSSEILGWLPLSGPGAHVGDIISETHSLFKMHVPKKLMEETPEVENLQTENGNTNF